MRGVYADAALMALVAWGSSPHARGLPVLPKLNPEGNRIIPACAGFTAGVPGSGRGRPDHPRMRGVYPGYTPGRDVYHGSSPHARGLRRHTMCRSHLLGIIPACAGFTPCYARKRYQCGGSSPHARGLRGHVVGVPELRRIIPACAGFTICRFRARRTRRDHPRVRGVYWTRVIIAAKGEGSSPHARGLRHRYIQDRVPDRIIPACAGFTPMPRSCSRARRDHPRTRGVYRRRGKEERVWAGSSPRARGLPRQNVRAAGVLRIIPACAGFTELTGGGGSSRRDHPRMRGVYSSPRSTRNSGGGSSPHARGLRDTRGTKTLRYGIIPACAGFTQNPY